MLIAGIASVSVQAAPAPDELDTAKIVFTRAGALWQSDGKGKNETQIATLPSGAVVRALRSDAAGKVLLADLSGKWAWMPLDGSTQSLTDLPCADGPAQLGEDALCVLCRSAKNPAQSIIFNLVTGKQTPIAIPAPGARIGGVGVDRKLIWADTDGIWAAPTANLAQKTKVAPDAPLRNFLPSSDGKRGVGIYSDTVHVGGPRKTVTAEILMGFALDGTGARRKGIKNGVPVDWSHSNEYVLVQDGGKACLMRANGGQYKCWNGYTGVSLSADGSYILMLGNRDAKAAKTPPKKAPKKDDKKAPPGEPPDEDSGDGDADADDDVPVPPPSGPLALYRGKLAGPYTEAPAQIVKVADGAAVWLP